MLDRWLRPELLRFAAVVMIVLCLAMSVYWFVGDTSAFRSPPGGDFIGLYMSGELWRQGRPYDLQAQYDTYHRIHPGRPANERFPAAVSPFLLPVGGALSLFPYPVAYSIWLALSAALFLLGCALVWSTREWLADRTTVFLAAFAFEPWLIEGWINGQLSAISFLALGAAMFFTQRGRLWAAGLSMSLGAVKPTLLLLIVPMLLVSRSWKELGGLAAGCAVLFLAGLGNWEGYRGVLQAYIQASTAEASIVQTWKYVDVNHFFTLMFGGRSTATMALSMAGGLGIVAAIVPTWIRGDKLQRWRLTAAATLVANLYIGIYEAAWALPAALALAERKPAPRWLLALLFLVPFTHLLAPGLRFQPITLVLAAVVLSWRPWKS